MCPMVCVVMVKEPWTIFTKEKNVVILDIEVLFGITCSTMWINVIPTLIHGHVKDPKSVKHTLLGLHFNHSAYELLLLLLLLKGEGQTNYTSWGPMQRNPTLVHTQFSQFDASWT